MNTEVPGEPGLEDTTGERQRRNKNLTNEQGQMQNAHFIGSRRAGGCTQVSCRAAQSLRSGILGSYTRGQRGRSGNGLKKKKRSNINVKALLK